MQKKEGRMKRLGTVKEIGGVVFIRFDKEKRGRSGEKTSGRAKDCLSGILAGALAGLLLAGIAEAKACSADAELPQEYISFCEEIGQEYHICPELLEAVIEAESNGDPDAVGELGEIGLMQIYPKYHRERAEHLKVCNLSDPKGNILVGADYLAELFKEHGDAGTVLMIYNGAKDAAERGRRGDYTEYAEKVMNRAAQLERLHEKQRP